MVTEPGTEDPLEGVDGTERPVPPDIGVLNLIRQSFVGRDEVIERAFGESQAFRDLCYDYQRCVKALHRWQQLEASRPASRSQEYTELLLELGREIQTWIEAVDVSNQCSGGGSA